MWNIQVTTYLIQIIVIQMQIQQIKNHKQEIEISKCKLQITPTANPRWFGVNVCKNIRSAMIFQPQCYLASRFLGNLSRVWAREGKSGRSLNDGKWWVQLLCWSQSSSALSSLMHNLYINMTGFLRQDCGDHHDHYQEDERRTFT